MSESDEIRRLVTDLATEAKAASRVLAGLDPARKNAVLARVADALRGEAKVGILVANEKDVAAAIADGMASAMLDRLRLTPQRLDGVADAVAQIARLDDPVGNVAGLRTLESGLSVGRMTIPLGVIGIIYESRPNVTVDAAALCLKSGNAVILRGGSEAFHSNQALAAELRATCSDIGLPEHAVAVEFDELTAYQLDIVLDRGSVLMSGNSELLDGAQGRVYLFLCRCKLSFEFCQFCVEPDIWRFVEFS